MTARDLATAIALALMAFGAMYLVFAFGAASFDITTWSDEARGFCAYLGATVAGAGAVAWLLYAGDRR